MNRRIILYIAITLVIAVIGGTILINRQNTEQPAPIQEDKLFLNGTEQIPLTGDDQAVIQADEQTLNEIQFQGLDAEFQEIDNLINQL